MARIAGLGREQPRPVKLSRPPAVPVLCLILALLTQACAGMAGVREVSQTYWREDMGRINPPTLQAGLQKIIQKYALRIDRREQTAQEIYFETNWIERPVMAEEQLRGVASARNRVVLRGRALEEELGGGNVFRVIWELQNEVTTQIGRGWHPGVLPAAVKEDFLPVYNDLFMEVRTGVKR